MLTLAPHVAHPAAHMHLQLPCLCRPCSHMEDLPRYDKCIHYEHVMIMARLRAMGRHCAQGTSSLRVSASDKCTICAELDSSETSISLSCAWCGVTRREAVPLCAELELALVSSFIHVRPLVPLCALPCCCFSRLDVAP